MRDNKYEKTYPENENNQAYEDNAPDRNNDMGIISYLLQSSRTIGYCVEIRKSLQEAG